MLRAYHFIPSHHEKYFSHLEQLEADAYVFDLEDGVPATERKLARENLYKNRELLNKYHSYIRINKADGLYDKEDIEILVETHVNGVVIPKVESADEIIRLTDHLGSKSEQLDMIILVESFKGLEELSHICQQIGDKIFGVGIGLEDFMSEVPVLEANLEVIEFLKMKMVSIARAHNLVCIDTVSLNYNDRSEAFRKECHESRDLFFDARFSIHPSQIPIIQDVYPPQKNEISWALSVMEKIKGKKNIGYLKVDGVVLSGPKVKKAQLILKQAGITDV